MAKTPSSRRPVQEFPAAQFVVRWGPAVAMGVAMAVMAGWTWGRWVDPYIDIGRELYVPWQLASGKVLYRDVAHFNGPLSPYFNALWFRFFGPGVWVLALVNCGLIIAITALVFNVVQRLADRFSAALAGVVFIALFAFGVFVPLGNYTYAAPYSHEMTHGVLLCFAVVAFGLRFQQGRRGVHILLMGLGTGLLALTKLEMFLAGFLASLAGLFFAMWPLKTNRTALLRLAALYVMGIFAPLVAAFLLLSLAMPAGQAWNGVLSPFMGMAHGEVISMPFYQNIIGLDAPMQNLAIMARMALGWLLILAPMGAGALLWGRPSRMGRFAGLAVTVLPSILLLALHGKVNWDWMARPFGLLLMACLAWAVGRWWKNRDDQAAAAVDGGRIVFMILALSLLAKMAFNQRITMYGFGLGMPAAMVLIALLTSWAPQHIQKAGGAGWLFRFGAISLILITGAVHLHVQGHYLSSRVHPLGTGRDLMFCDENAINFSRIMEILEKRIPPGKTLAVLPGCSIFNYLGRMPNSTPYITAFPPEMALFGEKQVAAAYKKRPPDFVLFVHYDSIVFGRRFFGRDYGQELFSWIRENYNEIAALGPRPFHGSVGGFLLLERKAPRSQAGLLWRNPSV